MSSTSEYRLVSRLREATRSCPLAMSSATDVKLIFVVSGSTLDSMASLAQAPRCMGALPVPIGLAPQALTRTGRWKHCHAEWAQRSGL